MIFNDCSKAETEKKQPEEERGTTPPLDLNVTMLSPELDKVLGGEIDKLQKEYFGTEPEEGQDEDQDTQPWS